jgi:hypothetical protein
METIEHLNTIAIVSRSIEPQQVNFFQKPVFTLLLQNTSTEMVTVLPETELWVVDYPSDNDRGFRATVETSIHISGNSVGLLRFLPTSVSNPEINSGSFPLRLTLRIQTGATILSTTVVCTDNTVRVQGSGGLQPIESVGFFSRRETLIVPRDGAYEDFSVIMDDMFPVDIEIEWQQMEEGWQVVSDDGVNLTATGSMILRQVRTRTTFGIWVYPNPEYPANQLVELGNLIVKRCPLSKPSGGLGTCIGAGGALRAVIPTSSAVILSDLSLFPKEELVVNPGGTFQIYGTLNNPFLHNVYIEGPAGANSFLNGTNASSFVRFTRLTSFRLGAGQTETVCWDFQIEDSAPAGIYTIQPFLRSRVWYNRPIWDRRAAIETAINDSDPQTNLFVQIEVKLP